MARLNDHHQPKAGVEGKCSVPMWQGGLPGGFCDRPAWGERYAERDPSRGEPGKYAPPHWPSRDRNGHYPPHLAHLIPPYAPGLCCDHHGGPAADAIRFVRDGNMWCAFLPGFENLQESIAGFGVTQSAAENDLKAMLAARKEPGA